MNGKAIQNRTARRGLPRPRRFAQRHRAQRRSKLYPRRTHHGQTHPHQFFHRSTDRPRRRDRHHRIHRGHREITHSYFDHETIQPSLSSYLHPRGGSAHAPRRDTRPSTAQAAINAASSGDRHTLPASENYPNLTVVNKDLSSDQRRGNTRHHRQPRGQRKRPHHDRPERRHPHRQRPPGQGVQPYRDARPT